MKGDGDGHPPCAALVQRHMINGVHCWLGVVGVVDGETIAASPVVGLDGKEAPAFTVS